MTLVSHIDAGIIRALFRLYFIGVLALIGIVGGWCYKLVARRRVLQGHGVKLTDLVGWLKGTDVFVATWQMRRFPGGLLLGSVMVLCGLVAIASDLTTTVLITQRITVGSCLFGLGMVVDDYTSLSVPPALSKPGIVASNAQIYSSNNADNYGQRLDCRVGIYRKVNQDQYFCAGADDVLDAWTCSQTGAQDYDGRYGVPDVVADLQKQGLQTLDSNHTFGFKEGPLNEIQFIVWSVDRSTSPIDMLVSVDAHDDLDTGALMRSYRCKLGSSRFGPMLEFMDFTSVIELWGGKMQGALYNGIEGAINDNTTFWMEVNLNQLVMVAGSNDSTLSHAPLGQMHQGCLRDATHISAAVIGLAIIVMIIFVGFTTWGFWLMFTNHMMARKAPEHMRQDVPSGVLDWLIHAAKHGTDVERGSAKFNYASLRKHSFKFGLFGHHRHAPAGYTSPQMAGSAPMSPMSPLSPIKEGTSYIGVGRVA